jgi:hypothetical protein
LIGAFIGIILSCDTFLPNFLGQSQANCARWAIMCIDLA